MVTDLSRGTSPRFRSERAISPADSAEWWVVIDPGLVAHKEASQFLSSLHAASCSPHTIRAYAGRVATFLTWCEAEGVDWCTVVLSDMARFKHNLESSPSAAGRYRSGSTVNAILTSVCEFLRFCARSGLIEAIVADRLSEPRFLRFTPPGFDPGESGRFRLVRARSVKARSETPFPEALTPEQSRIVISSCTRPRDRFVVVMLHDTGLRAGEALGLRREDMHFLPDSRVLGCDVVGAHLHVRRRANPNGAFAKSRFPRVVPASQHVLSAYGDYRSERCEILGEDPSEMVMVNLYHDPFGQPMSYRGLKDFFDRLARDCGFSVRPHMMRHTAATNWIRAGVDIDVVRALLGHVSLASTTLYLHARAEDCRRAVEVVAAGGTWR